MRHTKDFQRHCTFVEKEDLLTATFKVRRSGDFHNEHDEKEYVQ
jgi:hypothetical protein